MTTRHNVGVGCRTLLAESGDHFLFRHSPRYGGAPVVIKTPAQELLGSSLLTHPMARNPAGAPANSFTI